MEAEDEKEGKFGKWGWEKNVEEDVKIEMDGKVKLKEDEEGMKVAGFSRRRRRWTRATALYQRRVFYFFVNGGRIIHGKIRD